MPASDASADGEMDLREVRLLRLPLPILARAQEHNEGLMREFALIANPHPHIDVDVPVRMLQLIAALRDRYTAFTVSANAEIERAMERGDEEIDLTFRVPAAVAEATVELAAMLNRADDYCRQGSLLTLATPDDLVAFRRWYLGEFRAQINGARPTPWR